MKKQAPVYEVPWQSADGRLQGTLQGSGKYESLILDIESRTTLARENIARLRAAMR